MKRPELMITNGELSGKRFSVPEGGLRLGRSSSNDIHIQDAGLSRNHCLFETIGENGLKVTDLASANGTYVNGNSIDVAPYVLQDGDLIEVGDTIIKVVGEKSESIPVQGKVDLGFGGGFSGGIAGSPVLQKRRSPMFNILLLVAVIAAISSVCLVLLSPQGEREQANVTAIDDEPVLKEAYYEKVEADSNGIFRFELSLTPDNVLSVVVDDVPKENRHLTKSIPLDEAAKKELGDILAYKSLREIDREYAGVEPDPPELKSWALRTVYSTRSRSVRIMNTQEPEAFRVVRERLEAFSKNQLGVWALQYSKDKLMALAEESIKLGRSKWEEREVQHGNLFAAVSAYREAIFYLDTINPKPDIISVARRGLDESQAELEQRYKDQRFLADRAINLGQWDVALRELKILLELIPDRSDDRNREASAKLIDVEKRMKGGK